MEKQYNDLTNEGQAVSSTQSLYPPPNSNSPPESTSAELPPPYTYPSQSFPSTGVPYPPYNQPPLTPGMGYPMPYAPLPGGQSHCHQPGFVYPGPPAYGYQPQQPQQPQQQQQQQQQMVFINNQPTGVAPVVFVSQPSVSMVGAIALSCIVFWFCGWLCGGIAFLLAMSGQGSAAAGDTSGAIRLRNASYSLSIVGIVSGIIIIAVIASLYSSAAYRSRSCGYYRYGSYSCY